MPQKRHTVDQIVAKLRKADIELGKDKLEAVITFERRMLVHKQLSDSQQSIYEYEKAPDSMGAYLSEVDISGKTVVDFGCGWGWSAPLKRMRVLYEGSHKEIFDDQKAKTTKA